MSRPQKRSDSDSVNVAITNNGTAATSSWTVVLNTQQSSIYTSWNASFGGSSGDGDDGEGRDSCLSVSVWGPFGGAGSGLIAWNDP